MADHDDENDGDFDDGEELGSFTAEELADMSREIDFEADRREREALDDWTSLMWAISDAAVLRKMQPTRPPYMLGRFEAFETVDGGMGMVVIGHDPLFDRKVAIKLWKTTGPEAEAALLTEAKTLAKLSHPNVVGVYEVGKYRSSVYFVMQSVDGMSGHEWMHTTNPSWQQVRDVFIGAGMGLAAAHDANIHHRDFKPANMLVGDDGRVLILDFGIADTLRSTDGTSENGPARDPGAGTVTYMAPERLRGERGDARSDQFSFCVAMWKALYRVRPYPGESAVVLLAAMTGGVIHEGPWVAEVPGWLGRVVRKGLAEDPDLRYRNMHELVAALREGPIGGEAVDGESADVVLGGAPGRLLNAPGTGAQGSAADLDALADEILRRLQSRVGVLKDEGHSPGFDGDRPASPQGRSLPVLVLVASVVSTVASVGILTLMLLRPPTPVPVEPPEVETVEEDPLEVILAHVAAGRFSAAEKLWYEKRREKTSDEQGQRLSDDGSLAIGRACLARAEDLESTDPEKAGEAIEMADVIAQFVMTYGSDAKAKEAAGQLFRDVYQLRARPAGRND